MAQIETFDKTVDMVNINGQTGEGIAVKRDNT